ncbi:zinc finger and SCAN domain-containing protein 5B-like [Pteronotus mesoamericanus]|uniref:zinc finger and SCAN domain-containing protein 5B-like n=1 Tax=Pteronotus mesoamericanus TaxID=1884717 RepID=UPI0023EBBBAF|nr:zinc finger and SCAN domain-containing protein 5B-like [Pteronotus parnellii mesoamericanus]
MWHVVFRAFTCSEDSDPVQDLRKLSELCRLWLRPDLLTKEQILDKLVLEQFMISMPLELQVLVKDRNVQSCKDLEDMLRHKEKPKEWTVVTFEGQKFLAQNSDVQMAEVEAGDADLVMDLSMKSRTLVSEVEGHPKNSQEVSPDPGNQPGITDMSRAQGQEALLPETMAKEGDLAGPRPTQMLEKGPLEDQDEATVLMSPEPQLPTPEVPVGTEGEENLREGTGTDSADADAHSTHNLETDVLTQLWKRRDSQSARGPSRRKRDNTSTPQGVPEGGAISLDKGKFSRQLRSNSVRAPSTERPTGRPVRKEATRQVPYECADCKKRFNYESQLTIHQRTHTGERPFECQFCLKRFIQPSDLRVHQRIHTGEKPYNCRVCRKSFTHDSTLRGHEKVHTGEKPYPCEVCHKCFSHRGNLNVHLRTHTDLRPYRCHECDQAFRQLGTFKRHQNTHSNVTSQGFQVPSA